MLATRALRPLRRSVFGVRAQSGSAAREFKVVLDGGTLYVDRESAEALGWTPACPPAEGVPLTLSGWAPGYFAIARTGTDSDRLARATAESGHDPKVQQVLDYLKDR